MSATPLPDYYKTLQVDPLAEEEVIEAAYRRLARKYHPDVYTGPDASERMRELNLAYDVVGDPSKRRAYDEARRRALARQEILAQQELLARQAQMMASRTTGSQRAVTTGPHRAVHTGPQRAVTTGPHRAVHTGPHRAAAGDAAAESIAAEEQAASRYTRDAAMKRMHSTVPSVKASTGNWPAITPTTGKLPVTPKFVYRRPILNVLLEELHNLAQGILAVGLLGYPMAVAICWFPLQALWSRLGVGSHQALVLTLGLLVPPMLLLSWWLGRRIRRNHWW